MEFRECVRAFVLTWVFACVCVLFYLCPGSVVVRVRVLVCWLRLLNVSACLHSLLCSRGCCCVCVNVDACVRVRVRACILLAYRCDPLLPLSLYVFECLFFVSEVVVATTGFPIHTIFLLASLPLFLLASACDCLLFLK